MPGTRSSQLFPANGQRGYVRADVASLLVIPWQPEFLAQHEWHTDVSASADEAGRLRLRGYHGDYAVTARSDSGQVLTGSFVLRKGGPNSVRVECGEL